MLLVIDVGNTNTVVGLMNDSGVVEHWRISTLERTTDEFGLLMLQLLDHRNVSADEVKGAAISCVVPNTLYSIEKGVRRYLEIEPFVVGRGIRSGMRVRTDNPREVGADRIVNAVAAFERYGGPVLVVDFGTATTFDCVNESGDYIGGVICPGFQISAEALFERTAKLPRVQVERPDVVIGTNTVASMQSGLFYGYVGLVDGVAARCKVELGGSPRCVATGGLSRMIGQESREIDSVADFLTLDGLQLLWTRNR
jgi:type III pantothenate kinase